jgi:hypothetical protein
MLPLHQGCARTRDESPNRPCVFEDRDGARAVPWTIRRPYLRTRPSHAHGRFDLAWPPAMRIPESPISGRHGHARSKTRSANAARPRGAGESPRSFHGFCGEHGHDGRQHRRAWCYRSHAPAHWQSPKRPRASTNALPLTVANDDCALGVADQRPTWSCAERPPASPMRGGSRPQGQV